MTRLIWLALPVLIALQYGIEYLMVNPLTQEIADLQVSIQQQKNKQQNQTPPPPQLTVQLDQVLQKLQPPSQITHRFEALHLLAEQNGVTLRKAIYRNHNLVANLQKDEVTADLVGLYPNIRQFMRQMQAQDSAIAIESIEFSRPNAGTVGVATISTSVRAQAKLALYSHSPAP